MRPNAILLRYSEIFLKGGNRADFEKALRKNVARAVGPLGFRVERLHGRIVCHAEPGAAAEEAYPRALRALSQTFGLVSMSPAISVPGELEALSQAAVALARDAVERRRAQGQSPRPTFKIATRRSDKRFPMTSPEVSRELGAAVFTALDLPVDVHQPELVIGVEIGSEGSFVFGDVHPGPGGLPVGVSGRAVLLLSGGIDSPVAGWLTMKRGCVVLPLYFHAFPYTGDKTKEKVVDLCRLLAPWQGRMRLHVAPFTRAQETVRERCPPELLVVIYRRLMMRVADRLAEQLHAGAIVTGENLGQVASQTLENLDAIGRATPRLILRPLVANDKQETIALARRIGTYDTSVLPYEDCCSLFVPRHPATRAKLAEVQHAESRLDVDALVEQILAGIERIDVTA